VNLGFKLEGLVLGIVQEGFRIHRLNLLIKRKKKGFID
jgi:hypothetical protein